MTEKERLLSAVDVAAGRPRSARELGVAAGFHGGEATKVKRLLRELVHDGVLTREGKRYQRVGKEPAPSHEPERRHRGDTDGRQRPEGRPRAPAARRGREVVGILTLRREGYGFVRRLEGPEGDDVFLPPHELATALDGDRVRIALVPGKYGRDAGQLLGIVERRRTQLVGTYHARGRGGVVTPVDPGLQHLVPVRGKARDGEVVKVRLISEPGKPLEGEVEGVLGQPGDPLPEVLSIAYARGFSESFPAEVEGETEDVPDHVRPEDKVGRRDLTDLRLVTIDGEDARDFDDAIYVERRRDGGYRLVVAIADVAHYVRPETAIDGEALNRATSVYFPNWVLPMLPERLSNGICSLNPKVERLCMVCDLNLDSEGRPLEAELYEGVMLSAARCTYTQVAKVIAGEKVPELAHVAGDIRLAQELALKLRKQRRERGSIDFDLPEAQVLLDKDMKPTNVVKRERNDAHRLIEECMLAANEAVARTFAHRDAPTVYRVHGTPDPKKLLLFANLANAAGFELDVSKSISPRALSDFLARIEGSPQKAALNALLLRSMMQAVYTPENIGHYGLAAENYLHFTSPIRRYPDLMVHRLLKENWAHGGKVPRGRQRDELVERLDDVSTRSSERERAAMDAEREVDAYFKCLYVQDKVGQRFPATVVGVADFGFFAELDGHAVEGLVQAEELGTDWHLDENTHRLVFGSGLSFGMGDRVEVEIASVDLVRRQINLALVEDAIAVRRKPTPFERPKLRPRPETKRGGGRRPESRPRPGKPRTKGKRR